jgi:hypothetical protein
MGTGEFAGTGSGELGTGTGVSGVLEELPFIIKAIIINKTTITAPIIIVLDIYASLLFYF